MWCDFFSTLTFFYKDPHFYVCLGRKYDIHLNFIIIVFILSLFFHFVFYFFPLFCHLFINVLEVHIFIYMCLNIWELPGNSAQLSIAVKSILIWHIFILVYCSYFVFHCSNSSFLHILFLSFLTLKIHDKGQGHKARSNRFTHVIAIAVLSLTFLISLVVMTIMKRLIKYNTNAPW